MNKSRKRSPGLPPLLQAIPIRKDLKRYYWRKYHFVRKHNGARYASELFKSFRQTVMAYVDDPNRLEHLEEYLQKCPVRKNGWLKELFRYADTDPFSVIQFLKLYTTERKPVVSPCEAAAKLKEELQRAEPVATPPLLREWIRFVRDSKRTERTIREFYRTGHVPVRDRLMSGFISRFCRRHPVRSEAILAYRKYRARVLTSLQPKPQTPEQSISIIREHLPTEASYASNRDPKTGVFLREMDLMQVSVISSELNADLDMMAELHYGGWGYCTWPIVSALPQGMLEAAMDGYTFTGPEYQPIGFVHQIPKSGTVVRRSIADPNRFLQAGMAPYRAFLRSVSLRISRNCQFDQSRMDSMINERLQRGYAGSIDLHSSTDWLPLDWFIDLEREFFLPSFGSDVCYLHHQSDKDTHPSPLVASRNLFFKCARGVWYAESDEVSWKRGQPLGTLPSFEILTITHYAVLEALSVKNGLLWSPYALLGDDVVVFDGDIRADYIELMTTAGSPLSLHKSYAGRMVEFAGKLHIRNQGYRYSSNISWLTFKNLFDLQRSMQIPIPWGNLPEKVRRKVEKYAKACSKPVPAEDLYVAMQIAAGVQWPRSQMPSINDNIGQLVANYYWSDPLPEPALDRHPYFLMIGRKLGAYDHDINLPTTRPKRSWWKNKFRPEATDAIAKRCTAKSC